MEISYYGSEKAPERNDSKFLLEDYFYQRDGSAFVTRNYYRNKIDITKDWGITNSTINRIINSGRIYKLRKRDSLDSLLYIPMTIKMYKKKEEKVEDEDDDIYDEYYINDFE